MSFEPADVTDDDFEGDGHRVFAFLDELFDEANAQIAPP
jgi:hypothetical protein